MTNSIRAFLLSFLIAASAFAGSGKTPSSFILGTDFGSKTGFTLNTIITAIGSSDVKVILDGGQWDVTADVTIPANITLSLPPGSTLGVGAFKTVTFSGGSLEAPQTTIFVGSGSVVGTVKSLADWISDWGSSGPLLAYTLTHIQQLTGSSIVSNTITSLEILDRTIQDIDIAIGGVNSSNILDRTIQDIDIAIGGVNSSNILDGTINSNDFDAATLALITNVTAVDIGAQLNDDYALYRWGLPRHTINRAASSWEGIATGASYKIIDTAELLPIEITDSDVTTFTSSNYVNNVSKSTIYVHDLGEPMHGVVELVYKFRMTAAFGFAMDGWMAVSHYAPTVVGDYREASANTAYINTPTPYVANEWTTNSTVYPFTGRYLTFGFSQGGSGTGGGLIYEIGEILMWATNSAYANLGGLE